MNNLKSHLHNRAGLYTALIAMGYVILALAYSLVNPLFESPDEWLHYRYIRTLLDEGRLPIQTSTEMSEFHQPPLYYVSSALIAAPWSAGEYTPVVNSFWRYDGQPPLADNKNLYLHTTAEKFPWQGTPLIVHILRGWSVVLGVGTLFATYRLLQLVVGRRPWLMLSAFAIVAFNPQFLFISSSINNDNLVILLGALTGWWCVRVAADGLTLRRAIVSALLAGAALLSKLSAVAFVGLIVATVLIAPATWRKRGSVLCGLAIGVVVLAGWWFVRNMQLYGELTGVNTMLLAWNGPNAVTAPGLGDQLIGLWRSYWGEFGYEQIRLPDWYYAALAAATLVSLIGLPKGLVHWRRSTFWDWRVVAVLVIAPFLLLIATLIFAAQNPSGAHGRFLLPIAPMLALWLVIGWRSLWRPARSVYDAAFCGVVTVSMLFAAVAALLWVLAPAYPAPQLLSKAETQQLVQPTTVRFGEEATLLGYHLDRKHVQAGAAFTAMLCWEALRTTPHNVYAFIHLIDAANAKVAQRYTFPGLGHFPSVEWHNGDVFCDTLPVEVDRAAPTGVYMLEVGLVDSGTGRRLSPSGPGLSAESPVIVDRLKVQGAALDQIPFTNSPSIDLGGQIKLLGHTLSSTSFRAGESVTLTLYWQAVRVPDKDYTVFVHVLDTAGQPVTQADAMPQANRYPTSFWDVGEIVADPHVIKMPDALSAGSYPVTVGMYDLATGDRLSANGNPDGTVPVGALQVEAK